MVNYSLEDFEIWATENNIPTHSFDWKLTVQQYRVKPAIEFETTVKKALTNSSSVVAGFVELVKQWQRERESVLWNLTASNFLFLYYNF